MRSRISNLKFQIIWVLLFAFCLLPSAFPQDPQASPAYPLFDQNVKYANGTARGYAWAGSTGLTATVGTGSCLYGSPFVSGQFAGGDITVPASGVSYIYVNNAGTNCNLGVAATVPVGDVPIFAVTAGASTITTYIDLRSAVMAPNPTSLLGTGIGNGTSVLDVTLFSGATADVKFAAACAALPSGGGVLDARGFGPTTQSVASTISCGGPTKSVTFTFDRSTVYQPTTASTNMFQFSQGNTISGLHLDTTNQTAYSGLPIANASQSIAHFAMDHTFVNMASDATSPCMKVNATSGSIFVQFSDIVDFYCNAGIAAEGILLTATGSGWINANNFTGIRVVNAKYGIHLTAGTGIVLGNVFTDYEYEASELSTALSAVYINVTNSVGSVSSNQFSMNAWDLATGSLALLVDPTAKSCANFFRGMFGGAASVSDGTTCAVPDSVADTYGSWGLYQNQADMRIMPGNTLDIAGYLVHENSSALGWKEAGGTEFTVVNVDSSNQVQIYADPTTQIMNLNTSPGTQCLTLDGITSTAYFSTTCALNMGAGASIGYGGSRMTAARSGLQTLTFTSIAAQTCQDQTLSVPSAVAGTAAFFSPGAELGAGLTWSSRVSATGVVTVRVCNATGGAITPQAITWFGWVMN